MTIIKNLGLLRAMANAGRIILHADTGRKLLNAAGIPVTIYYIYGGTTKFMHKGKKYRIQYVDGCFYPYVHEGWTGH